MRAFALPLEGAKLPRNKIRVYSPKRGTEGGTPAAAAGPQPQTESGDQSQLESSQLGRKDTADLSSTQEIIEKTAELNNSIRTLEKQINYQGEFVPSKWTQRSDILNIKTLLSSG